MHPVLAALDLVLLVLSASCVALGRPRRWAWLLLLTAGAWLPLNNGVLEGAILFTVSATHGLTTADVVGVTGALFAGLRLWPPTRGRSAVWLASRAAVVVAVVTVGFVAAIVVTDERVDTARDQRVRAHLLHHGRQLPALFTADGGPSPSGTRPTP